MAARHERSRIVIDEIRQYLEARHRQGSAKAKIAEAIIYAFTR